MIEEKLDYLYRSPNRVKILRKVAKVSTFVDWQSRSIAVVESINTSILLTLLHQFDSPSIRYSLPSQEAGNTLATPLVLRLSMGGGDHLPCDGSPIRWPLEYAIKKLLLRVKQSVPDVIIISVTAILNSFRSAPGRRGRLKVKAESKGAKKFLDYNIKTLNECVFLR
ncbi:hypothetical protein EVAR_27004_1 [Eumeta japonica]|uniref:Uncharacterized protein n=1 Tax=Eumeta variegata TaxID=151549 RepID=A0A4C1Z6Z3_EUMVA|nr:hypothetical protein EVAR_27004_1 [Eumeta japonica]